MKVVQRTDHENIGVYSVYWNIEEDDNGGSSMQNIVVPTTKDTPVMVKLAIIQSLLTDLNIPVRIEEHMIPKEKPRW